ncbi:MAG TPA: di-heme oxidoredictase family protein, partial [Blastocatellia bacterium]|nr:di-heme oxidoredictase family protein [Blastocatellia bacterium]
LGPVYNAQSCRECHKNTVSGGGSQVLELRAGVIDEGTGAFFNPCVKITNDSNATSLICNRSLINLRAICPAGPLQFTIVNGSPFNHPVANVQERVDNIVDPFTHESVPEEQIVTTFRLSLSTLGDGLVEVTNSNTLAAIANAQPAAQRGVFIVVPLLENPSPAALRVGRFGWKAPIASLLTFSSGAYLNEMGITNTLSPNEITTICDEVAGNEDEENDVAAFARFMRATKAPPRGPGAETSASPNSQIVSGSQLFDSIGCAVCHVRNIVTSPVGAVVNCGTFTVPQGLGCRVFHPFGDFLLHDIGTSDGIVESLDLDGNLDQGTATLMRTAPLWGLRIRPMMMHDGQSLTFADAIRRHRNQALASSNAFFALTSTQKENFIAFLKSL